MNIDMSPVVWQQAALAALALALVAAVVTDLRSRRIPNTLVLATLMVGLLTHVIGPSNGEGGLFSYWPGALGAQGAVLGALTGLALFLPLYLLRAMGAGDVKLMAGIGSFAGPAGIVNVVLFVLVVGGVLAVLRMLWVRKSRLVLFNTTMALTQFLPGSAGSFDPATQSADRMPYALSIACGVALYGAWILVGGGPLIHF